MKLKNKIDAFKKRHIFWGSFIKLRSIVVVLLYSLLYFSNSKITLFNILMSIIIVTIISIPTIMCLNIITFCFNKLCSIFRKNDRTLLNKNESVSENTIILHEPVNNANALTENTLIVNTNTSDNSNDTVLNSWYISVSFGKSTSDNYQKAVILAKSAPHYYEQMDDGKILHQAIYSSQCNEYLNFVLLYELVKNWKSSFVMINGDLIDRKIVGNLNYCYGDRCRSGNPDFCYGASYMTENPFGCHRLQISACNNPWWSYYKHVGNRWVLDKTSMLQRINSYANIYNVCPMFNYEKIISVLNQLPNSLSDKQIQSLQSSNRHTININI